MSGEAFYFKQDHLFCEGLEIETLLRDLPASTENVCINGHTFQNDIPTTPLYVYSREALRRNVRQYLQAFEATKLNGVLGYAVKANGNLKLLETFKSEGVEMVITVSGYEVLRALEAGFEGRKIILNGNGKQRWEVKLGIEHNVILNVDSKFDAERLVDIASHLYPDKEVQVLLRVRPPQFECSPDVHPYVNTSGDSKFGFDTGDMTEILAILQEHEKIKVQGIHCHLGSCIYDPRVYHYIGGFVKDLSGTLASAGIHVKLLDIGGGIGINYHGTLPGFQPTTTSTATTTALQNPLENTLVPSSPHQHIPSVIHFIQPLSELLPPGIPVLLEPGRSLIANACMLVTNVLGRKRGQSKNFAVVDAAMTDLLRPSLYGSHHGVYPTGYSKFCNWEKYDVVGPVCESGDFLAKEVLLPAVGSSSSGLEYLAVADCGAYGAAMASNYNLRPRAAEILVEGTSWQYIRGRETFNHLPS